jgi:hypothetical protein
MSTHWCSVRSRTEFQHETIFIQIDTLQCWYDKSYEASRNSERFEDAYLISHLGLLTWLSMQELFLLNCLSVNRAQTYRHGKKQEFYVVTEE